MPLESRVVAAGLVGVLLGLLAVGLVSQSLLRHAVQVIPVAVALWGIARRKAWGRPAALGVCALWCFIMLLIWLFLLGVARIVSGHYTPAEVVLTVLIAAAGAIAFAAGLRLPRDMGRAASLATALLFFGLAYGAVWLTYLPSFPR